ncbi:tetratricopeptide repeat protein [Niallia sp. 01092]|uniref:tetratricopeptide repeat protein n=1 Tax=unclassified Niallia TaxID=2837522 RepID=UPI003FCF57F9
MIENVKELLKNKEFEEAKKLLISLLEKNPDDAELNFYCGSIHDSLGFEIEAIKYYEKALSNNVEGELREMLFIQLGSSYRCIGEYQLSKSILTQGLSEFPTNLAIQTFLAITLYNLQENKEAVSSLLNVLLVSSDDKWIKKYNKAFQFYSNNLDEIW